ncbi:MAG: hypothetical protein ABIE94_03285 [archaeon]
MEELRPCCAGCGKKLEVFEGHYLKGNTIYDRVSGLTYNTGQVYCSSCFEGYMGKDLLKDSKKEETEIEYGNLTNIGKLEPGQTEVQILVEVVKKGEEKHIKKNGRDLRLVEVTVKDNTGEIILPLWNDIIEEVQEGDMLYIKNAYIRSWKPINRLSLGRNGEISKIS